MSDISDPSKVKRAGVKEKDIRRQQLNDIKTVLNNASGRRLMWRIMEECNTFGSIFNQNELIMARLSGKQDLGHFIMAEIIEADDNLLLKLMKDNKGRSK
jgi:hypothetical protein